jgi:enoyl-ACP reductase-like protein
MKEALTRAIPFRWIAEPIEIAQAILFFLSRRSDYITGQVLSVSGGLTMADWENLSLAARSDLVANEGVNMPKQISWALAAALAFVLAGNSSAQQTPPDPGAAANVRQSQQYEQVLNSNSSFRAKRMQQECGPVTDPELHASCVASFGGDGTPPPRKSRQH